MELVCSGCGVPFLACLTVSPGLPVVLGDYSDVVPGAESLDTVSESKLSSFHDEIGPAVRKLLSRYFLGDFGFALVVGGSCGYRGGVSWGCGLLEMLRGAVEAIEASGTQETECV